MPQERLDESQAPFSQPKGTNSRSPILQDKDDLKRSMVETSNTNMDLLLATSRVKMKPALSLFTPNPS